LLLNRPALTAIKAGAGAAVRPFNSVWSLLSAESRPAQPPTRREIARIDLRKQVPQVLVLTPTRELAIQVAEAFQKYAAHRLARHGACG